MGSKRVILIDSNESRREARAKRLRSSGYVVHEVGDGAEGAGEALASPPAAVVAELWMPSVSGVQLCRLLKAEAATCDVPVVLCGDEEPRNRFWAERAGASSYVIHGRTGELMRALDKAIAARPEADAFFTQLPDGSFGIRDRIARQLDEALFESVIASEIRALASVGSFERLFDRLAQFLSQVTRYRWLALAADGQFAVHHHPAHGAEAIASARAVLGVPNLEVNALSDEDAAPAADGSKAHRVVVPFADSPVASFAIAPAADHEAEVAMLSAIVARELGGAIKIASLVEESRRIAATDSLTGLCNRRAFTAWMGSEVARYHRYGHPLSVVLLDVDHFKRINDEHGHGAGDRVLAALGELLRDHVRLSDLAARWGGEEFVVTYTNTDEAGAMIAAERLRIAIEAADVSFDGKRIPFTASLGLASAGPGETLESLVERADRAMYMSKHSGRNRLTLAGAQLALAAS